MINPVPRQLMREHLAQVAARYGGGAGAAADVEVEISVDHGEEIARSTWNPRLGILGGLSILGTTGIVVPYSCSAWIDSIRRGVDVARAADRRHVAGCTGSTSEKVAVALHHLPEDALLDMGDFAGAVLKYIRRHPVERLTICGGFAKLSKLAAGHLDLHSARSQVDKGFLAELARRGGADEALAGAVAEANTAWRRSSCAARRVSRWGIWWRRRHGRVAGGAARRTGRGRCHLHRPGGDGGGAGGAAGSRGRRAGKPPGVKGFPRSAVSSGRCGRTARPCSLPCCR